MVFIGLNIHIARFRSQGRTGGGPYLQDKIPVWEIWLKMGGGLYMRGGVFTGHYGTTIIWYRVDDHNFRIHNLT